MVKDINSIIIRSDTYKSSSNDKNSNIDFFNFLSNESDFFLKDKEKIKVFKEYRKFNNASSSNEVKENASENDRAIVKAVDRYSIQQQNHFLSLIENDNFEFGYRTNAEKFLEERLLEDPLKTKEWLNTVFNLNFGSTDFMVKILHIMGGIEYELINPQGTTMAVMATRNPDEEVKELGIRVFENWGNTDALHVLKSIKCEESWLQEYLDEVIQDLEKELGRNDVLS